MAIEYSVYASPVEAIAALIRSLVAYEHTLSGEFSGGLRSLPEGRNGGFGRLC